MTVRSVAITNGGKIRNDGNSDILQCYKEIQQVLRPNESLFSKFLLVSGLRMREAITSFNLIIKLQAEGNLGEYFNTDLSALEHFKFKDLFLRRAKNCFITFIDPNLVSEISSSTPLAYAQIRKRLLNAKYGMRFNEFRDFYVTFILRNGIIEYECNMLQRRISPDSILTKFSRNKLTTIKLLALTQLVKVTLTQNSIILALFWCGGWDLNPRTPAR